MNHTRNATLNFVDPMKVFLLIEPDLSLNEVSAFKVEIGMRNFNRTRATDDDDDDDEKPVYIDVVMITKDVTLNERTIILAVLCGVILYNCKKRFCDSSWKVEPTPFNKKKVFVSTDVEIAEIWKPEDDYDDEVEKLTNVKKDIERLSIGSTGTKRASPFKQKASDAISAMIMEEKDDGTSNKKN